MCNDNTTRKDLIRAHSYSGLRAQGFSLTRMLAHHLKHALAHAVIAR